MLGWAGKWAMLLSSGSHDAHLFVLRRQLSQCSECNCLQGDNQFSQLGTGDNVNSTTPVAVAGGRAFRSLTCGLGFTCALDSEDQAWCWGECDAGSCTALRRRRVLVGQHKLG